MLSSPSCPRCASPSLRQSRWASREEKLASPGQQPRRCQSCGHRFLVAVDEPARPVVRLKAVRRLSPAGWLAASLLALVLLVLLALLWPEAAQEQAPVRSEETSPAQQSALFAAAQAGDADAQYRLGRAALLDLNRSREEAAEAMGWIRQAASQGHHAAMVQLGKLYRNGLGVTQNYALAHKWVARAAGAGDPEGMLELGRLYRSGIGVEPDLVQAYVWFNRAAAAHSFEGAQERDSIGLKLSAEELKRAQTASLDEGELLADELLADELDEAQAGAGQAAPTTSTAVPDP